MREILLPDPLIPEAEVTPLAPVRTHSTPLFLDCVKGESGYVDSPWSRLYSWKKLCIATACHL